VAFVLPFLPRKVTAWVYCQKADAVKAAEWGRKTPGAGAIPETVPRKGGLLVRHRRYRWRLAQGLAQFGGDRRKAGCSPQKDCGSWAGFGGDKQGSPPPHLDAGH